MVLTEKQQMLRKLFRQFAETEFTDELLDRLEETGEFDRAIHDKMARCGFLGVKIPVEYGGQGGDSLAYAMMVEEFARVSPVLSIYANTSNSLGAGPLLYCGTEEQKRNYVIPVAKGEKILVFALTEPGAGSDAGGTLTSAVQAGDEFILNGRKTFISGAPFADYAVVYAKTDPSQKGSKGISMFLVDMKLPGVSCGKPEHKMGIVGYPTSDIILEDVHVHKSDLLGPLHKGFSTAMKTLDGGRLGMAAQAVGIAQGCLDASVKYAKERKQFGKPIAKFQAISFMLADMATEIEAARQLVYSTAVRKDAGDPESAKLCAMSKLYAAEMCNRAAYKAVQIHGGYGYIKEYKVERFYRDARITSIYEGTSQVQQMVISGSLLK
ncbi:acyl-CoA dehydrogenase family protein [Flavonifractor sp. DFI.6.63]|uniref:Acyl-CoA dehydrogenase family protein n=1 Tax=Lawsonibacter hominis TaxID=2763053 RepID=A0A8J6J4F2_9FIRM|nr:MULTISPECIES: acyl-CoA dehydrogenase family protein [Oscillospiraceae]MBS1382974.1 acyl-CoA dehydrogenase [Flavonifractor sp.]MDU2195666.1 acyl-CoA dehydrogenase family protein [Clostridiales bacterium]MDY2976770.1 acyl-CoA dehydrogenase family protein [Oscillospiraceae bacterium]MBC5733603.1 acyl-CoA dehydrogenase family protein [Lawsonibacter hominis]MCI6399974.1 acyl-CoA dehydrogenase family protein [Lawsonibacter sp.]